MRARTKEAIGAIRHVFVETDEDGEQLVETIARRHDLPRPSYTIESSPNRLHVLWRVTGFTTESVERLQKHLASKLGTDLAATPCSQTTRLPGYVNHKYSPGHLVTVEYRAVHERHARQAFPAIAPAPTPTTRTLRRRSTTLDVVSRASWYLAKVEPAIAGQHGDLHTFKVCCRIVRGFDLSDEEAIGVLRGWNLRCQPPWSEREMRDKIVRARKYGLEPIGAFLECQIDTPVG